MDSPSRRRYEYAMPNVIGPNNILPHGIAAYSEGKKCIRVKWPARVMICMSYNYFITVCITKHFVFPLFPWNWFFNIKKELDFIKKHKDMFFKYWNNEDIYGDEICHILSLMYKENLIEDEAVNKTKKEYYE